MRLPKLSQIRSAGAHMGFYIVSIAVAVVMWRSAVYVDSMTYIFPILDNPAANSAGVERAMEAYQTSTNILVTLATGLIGGLGFLIANRSTERYALRIFWPAAVSALCACDSLYWGYLSEQDLEWAMEVQLPTLGVTILHVTRQIEAGSLLLGVVFFADFVRLNMIGVKTHEGPTNASEG